jgi:hypothetical protein
MSEFLEGYGVSDQRRERIIKRLVIWGVAAVVIAGSLYFYFRTWRQEQVMKQFLAALSSQDFQGAYRIWGCTPEMPCQYYTPEDFTRDWGPSTPYANASAARIEHVDYCGQVVVFVLNYPHADPVSVTVDRSTGSLGFAAWERCPGRHWQFGEFFRRMFSSGGSARAAQ